MKKALFAGLAIAAVGAAVFMSSRWSNPQPLREPAPVDLEVFNRARVERQAALIDSLTAAGDWTRGAGGLTYRFVERGPHQRDSLRRGDWVHWSVRVALADDSVCFERPLAFKWQAMDVPTGFHDLAGLSGPGDSVEAWLPAHLAWGLSGYGQLVPPDVVIHLQYRWEGGS